MFNLFKLRKPKSIKLIKEQMKFLTKCIIKATKRKPKAIELFCKYCNKPLKQCRCDLVYKRKPKFTFKTYLKNKGGHLFDCEINNGGKCDCQPPKRKPKEIKILGVDIGIKDYSCVIKGKVKKNGVVQVKSVKFYQPMPCQFKKSFVPFFKRSKPLSKNCPICSNPKPFSFIPVDDVRNPHCIKCGKPLLLEPSSKDKEIQNEY